MWMSVARLRSRHCFLGGTGGPLHFLMLLNEAIDQRGELFAGPGQFECLVLCVPVKLEARGQRGYPDLAHGRVGRNNELARGVIEDNVENAILLFNLEARVLFFFALKEIPFRWAERPLCSRAKLQFVHQAPSVKSRRRLSR